MSEDARTKVIELIERKYKKLIQHIAREILRDSYLVEDAYQEILLKFIAGHEDKFELPQDEIKNYLCAAVRNTALTMLQELLSKLDNKDKDILCLKYGEGYDNKEIGEMIDLSEEAVRKRLYRTRIRMQSILIERERR